MDVWLSEVTMSIRMSHVLLDDIRCFLIDGTHPGRRASPKKQQFIDFFNACRDPNNCVPAPWPADSPLLLGAWS